MFRRWLSWTRQWRPPFTPFCPLFYSSLSIDYLTMWCAYCILHICHSLRCNSSQFLPAFRLPPSIFPLSFVFFFIFYCFTTYFLFNLWLLANNFMQFSTHSKQRAKEKRCIALHCVAELHNVACCAYTENFRYFMAYTIFACLIKELCTVNAWTIKFLSFLCASLFPSFFLPLDSFVHFTSFLPYLQMRSHTVCI